MRKIDEIIVHCSATRADWMAGSSADAKRDEIRRWHVRDNGWSDIGYHAIIDRDGTVATGRDRDHDGDVWEEIGAHVGGRNVTTLGVCLIGGHGSNETDAFGKNFTPMQEAALARWIDARMAEFPSITVVSGHNQYAAKACPGFRANLWWVERLATKKRLAEAQKFALDEPFQFVPASERAGGDEGEGERLPDATIDAIVERVLLRLLERGATLDASVTIDLKQGT